MSILKSLTNLGNLNNISSSQIQSIGAQNGNQSGQGVTQTTRRPWSLFFPDDAFDYNGQRNPSG